MSTHMSTPLIISFEPHKATDDPFDKNNYFTNNKQSTFQTRSILSKPSSVAQSYSKLLGPQLRA